jgi:hypothetical protein
MKEVQEYCWGITQEQGSCAVTEPVSVCWSLDFNWTPLHTHTQLSIFITNSNLHKIQFVPDLLKHN